jgi:hypothetical protein
VIYEPKNFLKLYESKKSVILVLNPNKVNISPGCDSFELKLDYSTHLTCLMGLSTSVTAPYVQHPAYYVNRSCYISPFYDVIAQRQTAFRRQFIC